MSYVRATGPRNAKIVFVGDNASIEDGKSGKPFSGRNGKMFTHLLAQAGLLREICYLTNVIKESCTYNNVGNFIDLSKKIPVVSDEGYNYIQILQQELMDLRPNVVVAVGNVALWALTGERGISKWRNSVLEGFNGMKVIPILPPGFAMNDYVARHLIYHDLQTVALHQNDPTVPKDEREYIIFPGYAQTLEFLDECLNHEHIAFDIEVGGDDDGREVSCISFAYNNKRVISIPFSNGPDPYFLPPQEIEVWLRIEQLLESSKVIKIAQNASFDVTFLYRKYGIRTKNIRDTMIAEGIIHPDFKKGLGAITAWYTTMPYYKDEGKTGFKSQYNEGFFLYNAKDSIVLMEAYPRMVAELKKLGNYDTFLSQCELIEPLTYMSERGFRVDKEGMEKKSRELGLSIEEDRLKIQALAGYDINPASPAQLIEYFYEEKGYPVYKNRKTGRPTTDEMALKRLSRKGAKEASLILDMREKAKLKSTYLDVKLGNDDRLRGSFNPIGTSTLRLSSSSDIFGVGTNLQNLPPRMKANILPDEGYVMFEIDLAQAENRVVAYIAPEPKMMAAFEQGLDIHSQTAGMMFDMDINTVIRLNKEYSLAGSPSIPEYCPPIGQGNKPFRYWGKQANHALNYGLGPNSAALRWEIPQNDAKFIYERYHTVYPGVRQMHRWIEHDLRTKRCVTNLFGFSRYFLGRWEDIVKQAYAFVAQSTIGEVLNRRGVKYIYYRTDLFPEVQLLNQIHDSVVFQIPLEVGWDRINRIINLIIANLQNPLEFRGRIFSTPADVKVIGGSMTDGVEVKQVNPASLQKAWEESVNN